MSDIEALRNAIGLADRLIDKQREALGTALQLKRTLVRRLLHQQHPHLTVAQERELFKQYRIDP